MLAEFIALGADKQRLKVWLAQYLLTNDAPLSERDRLLVQMEHILSNLQSLLVNDQLLSDDEQDYQEVNRQIRALSILETNIFALKRSLLDKESITLSEAEIWRLLIQTFDKLEGLDLKSLIAEAIELQRQRASKAESAAVDALSKVRTIVLSLAVFGSITAVLLAVLLLRALYSPITRLLEGTSAVASGNFTHRIAELDDKEFRNVATSFNTMSAALEEARQAELRHTLEIEQEVSSRTAQLKHALEQLKQAEAQHERQVLNWVQTERLVQPRLGTRKLHHLMQQQQLVIGRDKLFDLLRLHRLLVPTKRAYHKTTQSQHRFYCHPNLLKQGENKVHATGPEQVWVADITYLPTRQGEAYLSLITDVWSRKIVGYHVHDSLRTDDVILAYQRALKQRQNQKQPLVHHSDRGIQYCSARYQALHQRHDVTCSMTDGYDCYQNALAERVNGILKNEYLLMKPASLEQAVQMVEQTVQIYNSRRPHLALKYKTPDEVHRAC
ncbi:MAG TPA: IS3 family transposase [Rheinheimera sp.]|nr:IS3 family transposase [Rheinheimera sp.]